MKRLITLLLISFLLTGLSFAQDDRPRYDTCVTEAYGLYKQKEFLKAARKYEEAFAALGGKAIIYDRYNAACSWTLAAKPDSAFVHLYRMGQKGNYTDLAHLTNDPDFHALHADKRWDEVVEIVRQNKEKAEVNFDRPLIAALDSIYQNDQQYRMQLNDIEQQYGWESPEMKAQWELIGKTDSINLVRIRQIIDTRGWLGADVIGETGNATLFLVIQHADQQTQETYLPIMRDAVKKGNAEPSSLALLEDRVALGQGKKQLYGSQIGRDEETGEFYVLPLEDPDHVDERRAAMNLGSLNDYVAIWGFVWDAEAYKKQLPEIEEKAKRKR